MPKLRHIAIHAEDPFVTAEFYKRAFGMTELRRRESEDTIGIRLTDGDFSLTIMKFKNLDAADRPGGPGRRPGVHHIGFWVENLEEARQALGELGAEYCPDLQTGRLGDVIELKYRGPDHVLIDVTPHGWEGVPPPYGWVGKSSPLAEIAEADE